MRIAGLLASSSTVIRKNDVLDERNRNDALRLAQALPGELELTGKRRGTYSVTISGNWLITFRFEGEDAFDVDLEDYH